MRWDHRGHLKGDEARRREGGLTPGRPLRSLRQAFNTLFIDLVNRVLPIKKGVAVADRVVKFVAQYVSYTVEQGGSSFRSRPRRADGY